MVDLAPVAMRREVLYDFIGYVMSLKLANKSQNTVLGIRFSNRK